MRHQFSLAVLAVVVVLASGLNAAAPPAHLIATSDGLNPSYDVYRHNLKRVARQAEQMTPPPPPPNQPPPPPEGPPPPPEGPPPPPPPPEEWKPPYRRRREAKGGGSMPTRKG
ncbi:hypothetical protein O0L34_g15374 [Tuta absoluta]|nr:hypothetical protein O0L34_g15374 [Tuta absoluta]